MKIQPTNQQIDDAIAALRMFDPPLGLKLFIRLGRNQRKLEAAQKEKEHDRIRLAFKLQEPNAVLEGAPKFTAAQNEELQNRYEELQAEHAEVEIHPVELYDSAARQTPQFPELSIDIANLDAKARSLVPALIDIVFFETGTIPAE